MIDSLITRERDETSPPTYLEAGGPVVVGAVRHVELEHDPPLELLLVPHALLTAVGPVSLLHHLLIALLPVPQVLPTRLVERLVLAGIINSQLEHSH